MAEFVSMRNETAGEARHCSNIPQVKRERRQYRFGVPIAFVKDVVAQFIHPLFHVPTPAATEIGIGVNILLHIL
jgi:hypothetical protein